ncbi:hypothetical protein J6590_025594 [Homalodisca vitripennis]|nr:hypothetical protein J6590_025594 [Homalodisca vitripennis]
MESACPYRVVSDCWQPQHIAPDTRSVNSYTQPFYSIHKCQYGVSVPQAQHIALNMVILRLYYVSSDYISRSAPHRQ